MIVQANLRGEKQMALAAFCGCAYALKEFIAYESEFYIRIYFIVNLIKD